MTSNDLNLFQPSNQEEIKEFLLNHYSSYEDSIFNQSFIGPEDCFYPNNRNDNLPLERVENYNNNPLPSIQIKIENKITAAQTEAINNKTKKDNINFKTYIQKKRGRQTPFSSNKKIHSKNSHDLIKLKLQSNYITYLKNLANDAVKSFFGEKSDIPYFLDIKHSNKKKLFKPDILKSLKYKDIFNLEVSKKNKGKYEMGKTNIQNYENICNQSPILKEFFEQNYLDIFKNYYLENKRKIIYKGLIISLSNKTQTFDDLINKGHNCVLTEKIKTIINSLYYI